MAKVNLLKAGSMFTGIQNRLIGAATKVFTCPDDRAIKVTSLRIRMGATGGAAKVVSFYLGTNVADAIWSRSSSSTYDTSAGGTNTGSLEELMPIVFQYNEKFTVVSDEADVDIWICYEEYSEDASVTSTSGFTVS